MLLTEYFAVVVTDLPDYHDYGSVKELKALLWNHLERVISEEPHIKQQFVESAKHSEIVNIHFGMKSFGKMKILLDIYGDMKEQMREEARKKLDKDVDNSSHYDKSIDKLGQKIEKNINSYNKYELTHTDKPVAAYVMLRSMEGRERVINAYKAGAVKRWCLINCCCQEKKFKNKYFFDEWMSIKSANRPILSIGRTFIPQKQIDFSESFSQHYLA
jgi:hypothetical protein